ncbi:uncharacterized protein [Symphalangus syndactylus]|uniref:uncharacterized protein n=1 Tax=Symphalangus syndactylus TaxID=9590 RepID=UPI00300666F1
MAGIRHPECSHSLSVEQRGGVPSSELGPKCKEEKLGQGGARGRDQRETPVLTGPHLRETPVLTDPPPPGDSCAHGPPTSGRLLCSRTPHLRETPLFTDPPTSGRLLYSRTPHLRETPAFTDPPPPGDSRAHGPPTSGRLPRSRTPHLRETPALTDPPPPGDSRAHGPPTSGRLLCSRTPHLRETPLFTDPPPPGDSCAPGSPLPSSPVWLKGIFLFRESRTQAPPPLLTRFMHLGTRTRRRRGQGPRRSVPQPAPSLCDPGSSGQAPSPEADSNLARAVHFILRI